MNIDAVPVLLVTLAFVYLGGFLALFLRALNARRAYLRRLPTVEGIRLHEHLPGLDPWRITRLIGRVLRQPQSDPELERLRREAQRRIRYYLIWAVFGPIIVFGTGVLLIVLSSRP